MVIHGIVGNDSIHTRALDVFAALGWDLASLHHHRGGDMMLNISIADWSTTWDAGIADGATNSALIPSFPLIRCSLGGFGTIFGLGTNADSGGGSNLSFSVPLSRFTSGASSPLLSLLLDTESASFRYVELERLPAAALTFTPGSGGGVHSTITINTPEYFSFKAPSGRMYLWAGVNQVLIGAAVGSSEDRILQYASTLSAGGDPTIVGSQGDTPRLSTPTLRFSSRPSSFFDSVTSSTSAASMHLRQIPTARPTVELGIRSPQFMSTDAAGGLLASNMAGIPTAGDGPFSAQYAYAMRWFVVDVAVQGSHTVRTGLSVLADVFATLLPQETASITQALSWSALCGRRDASGTFLLDINIE